MHILKAIFLILLALSIGLLFLGQANVVSMFLFYVSSAWICLKVVNYLNRCGMRSSISVNLRIALISTTIVLIAVELFLRYVKADFKSYNELNGSFNYVSEKIQRRALSVMNNSYTH